MERLRFASVLSLVLACSTFAEPPKASPAATPTPAAVEIGRVPAASEDLSSVAKKIKLNRNAAAKNSIVTGSTVPRAAVKTPTTDENTAPHPIKAKIDGIRKELADAKAEYEKASSLNTVVAYGQAASSDAYQAMLAARNAALTPYRIRVDNAEQAWAAVQEECRKTSDCMPGWLR